MKSKTLLKEKTVHGTALVPIAIHHLSYDSNDKDFFYLHWHYEFEFVYVLEGAILYTIEGKDYCIMAGEGLFINSNELHAAKSYNGLPCEACVLLFHPNIFDSDNQTSTYSRFIYPIINGELKFYNHFRSNIKWQQSIMNLIREIDTLRNEDLSENELLFKSRIFEIWHLCYKNSISSSTESKNSKNYKLKRIQPVLDYIHENYKEEISLETLANILPMSKGQFCHTFKEVMNISPVAYVIRYRILKSCTLLTETDWKVSDISRYVGFNNISYFNREFFKAVRCTPGKYRTES